MGKTQKLKQDQSIFQGSMIQSQAKIIYQAKQSLKISQTNFIFSGDIKKFKAQTSTVAFDDRRNILNCHIKIVGKQVHQIDYKCYTVTIVLGIFLLFPFLFMCCQWWKRKAFPLYELSEKAYLEIHAFMVECDQVDVLSLTIIDNHFTKQKAQILFKTLSKMPKIKYFNLVNKAAKIDFKEQQASLFHQRIQEIIKLPIKLYIKWGSYLFEK